MNQHLDQTNPLPEPPSDSNPGDDKRTSVFKRILSTITDRKKSQVVGPYLETYYFQLLNEFDTLPEGAVSDVQATGARENIVGKHESKQLSLHDIFKFETIILLHQPLGTLRRRAWELREQYKRIVDKESYEAYLRSISPEPIESQTDIDTLRDDLLRILRALHWHYAVIVTRESVLRDISRRSAERPLIMVIVLGLISLAYLVIRPIWPQLPEIPVIPAIIFVFIVGAVGGFVSTEMRLQNSQVSGDEPIEEIVQLAEGSLAIENAPLLGGIFAVVLFVILAAGLVKGDLFPNIQGPGPNGTELLSFRDFWANTGAHSALDSAKLLIWSFLAGFAERLVPDALNRIAATSK